MSVTPPGGQQFGLGNVGPTPERIAETDAIRLTREAQGLVTEYGVERRITTTRLVDQDDPLKDTITDVHATITDEFSPIDIAGVTYRARLGRLTGKDEEKYGSDIYLVLDKTDDDEVVVDEFTLIRFEVGDRPSDKPGLYTPNGVNQLLDIQLASNIIREIKQKAEQNAKVKRDTAATEKLAADKLIAQKKERFWDGARTVGSYAAGGAAILAVAGGVVGGIAWAATSGCDEACELDRVAAADKATAPLTEGTVLGIGEEGSPTYSVRAAQDDRLQPTNVPEIYPEGSPDSENPNALGKTPDKEASLKGVRIFRVVSGEFTDKPGGKCDTVYVDFDSPEDKVIVTTPDKGRVAKYKVKVGANTIQLCWNTELESTDQMPYVLVQKYNQATNTVDQPADAPAQQVPRPRTNSDSFETRQPVPAS